MDLAAITAENPALDIGPHTDLGDTQTVGSIVVLGPSCAGKSTMVDTVRGSGLTDDAAVCVPKRFVTRPPRKNEVTGENRFVSKETFQDYVASGKIGLHWKRAMEEERTEYYGFAAVNRKSAVPVFSGNNALYKNMATVKPSHMLEDALIVGVYAPYQVRKKRLLRRSPDLLEKRPEEVRFRLRDRSDDMLPHVDIIIENYGTHKENAPDAFRSLVQAVQRRR